MLPFTSTLRDGLYYYNPVICTDLSLAFSRYCPGYKGFVIMMVYHMLANNYNIDFHRLEKTVGKLPHVIPIPPHNFQVSVVGSNVYSTSSAILPYRAKLNDELYKYTNEFHESKIAYHQSEFTSHLEYFMKTESS